MKADKGFFYGLLISLSFLFHSCSYLSERPEPKYLSDDWKFITLSETKKYEVYVDENSIKVIDNSTVSARVKLFPSKGYRTKIRREFECAEKEVYREFGETANATEKVLPKFYDMISYNFLYKAKCSAKQIEVYNSTGEKLYFLVNVKPNTPPEAVLNYLCSFVNQKK
jgi:hypothetical protein